MEQPQLILIGGGGHCKSVIDAAESAGRSILGIIGRPEEVGQKVLGYDVIATDDDIPLYCDKCDFVITVGSIKSAALRRMLHNKVKQAGGRLATVVASTAQVSRHSTLGEGTVVLHHACVNADAKVGESVIINSCANIEHDTAIGNFCHISTGAMVNGGCDIGEECFIGSNSVLIQGVRIAANTVIGAGSVVIRDINTPGGLYVGNPANIKHTL